MTERLRAEHPIWVIGAGPGAEDQLTPGPRPATRASRAHTPTSSC